MNVWTALLESLHSSLIDELIERHPEPKPTLGMPLRQKQPQAPVAGKLLLCEVLFGDEKSGLQRGTAMLAFEPPFMKALAVGPVDFWSAILKRAGSEFQRRNIRPRISNPVEVEARTNEAIQLPQGFAPPTRVIWIPFQVPKGSCYLGMAV
ncbi:MAG: hypothetical protein NDJ90_08615 [Oligoflexia bacterium]|nr:hypothetical protein [Oligoflexia bacterium]